MSVPRPNRNHLRAGLNHLAAALDETPGSPYVSPYISRKQAEAIVAAIDWYIDATKKVRAS